MMKSKIKSIKQKIIIKRMRVKIEIKNKLEGIKKLIGELNWKEKNFNKRKKKSKEWWLN